MKVISHLEFIAQRAVFQFVLKKTCRKTKFPVNLSLHVHVFSHDPERIYLKVRQFITSSATLSSAVLLANHLCNVPLAIGLKFI